MNCSDIAKYLYAFADGELGAEECAVVNDHMTVCADCATKVNLQKQLKCRVSETFANEKAPAGLSERILAAIQTDVDTPVEGIESTAKPSPIYTFWKPLAAAAIIALAAVGMYNQQLDTSDKAIPVQFAVTDDSERATQLADNVYAVHMKCSRIGEQAQDASLPHDGLKAAEKIRETLHYPMLRCATLDNREDTTFVSASYCQLTDCQGEVKKGGHLIYRFDNGGYISLISVPHLTELAQMTSTKQVGSDHDGAREYYILQPSISTADHPVTVTAFNCPKATHLVCVDFNPADSIDVIEHMSARYSEAQVRRVTEQIIAMASH